MPQGRRRRQDAIGRGRPIRSYLPEKPPPSPAPCAALPARCSPKAQTTAPKADRSPDRCPYTSNPRPMQGSGFLRIHVSPETSCPGPRMPEAPPRPQPALPIEAIHDIPRRSAPPQRFPASKPPKRSLHESQVLPCGRQAAAPIPVPEPEAENFPPYRRTAMQAMPTKNTPPSFSGTDPKEASAPPAQAIPHRTIPERTPDRTIWYNHRKKPCIFLFSAAGRTRPAAQFHTGTARTPADTEAARTAHLPALRSKHGL